MRHDTSDDWTAAQARTALASAPVVDLDELCPPGAILIVAPHPDDETLGCGGLIARAVDAGRTVGVAILTDGGASHPGSARAPPWRLARLRRREARSALHHLTGGSVKPAFFEAPDGRLGGAVGAAEDWLAQIDLGQPTAAIFAPWTADSHPDHKAALAVATALAKSRGAVLRCYPIWGLILGDDDRAGPPMACVGLDVAAVLDRKRRALLSHRSQISALIDDAPDGFRLSPHDLARHLRAVEPYFLAQL